MRMIRASWIVVCLCLVAGAVRAQERASFPGLEAQTRAELAHAGQAPVFTIDSIYQVDRGARATMRRRKRVALVEAERDAFDYMVARTHAEAKRRRLNATNEHLRAEQQRLANELRWLRD